MARTNANQPTEPNAVVTDAVSLSNLDLDQGTAETARGLTNVKVGETIVLDGYGVSLRVHRGELLCADGLADQRRERRISRASAAAGQLRRVLVLGDGMVTTEAMAWCHGLGVALVILGGRGEPLLVGGARLYRHGSLTRAQACAMHTDTGMTVVRWLLDQRLADQARIADQHLRREDRARAIHELRHRMAEAVDPPAAMLIEMQAAEHYWQAWADELHLTFAPKDRSRVPAHWARFGGRTSPLGEATGNRHAATPANAMINLGTRLAEIETTLACHALGLDPWMGLAHADRPHRPAFVLDLMEPLRGHVETIIWQLGQSRTFRKSDFGETQSGEVRVLAPFSHDFVAALLPALRNAVAPIAEKVAATLTADLSAVDVPTPLTRSRHKAAAPPRTRTRRGPSTSTALWTCPTCGVPVTNPQRLRCQSCIDADPGQTSEIRGRRGRAIAARRHANQEWEARGGTGDIDPSLWADIATGLADVKLAEIMAVTGFSKSFASVVRSGKSRPHPSHWPILLELASIPRSDRD